MRRSARLAFRPGPFGPVLVSVLVLFGACAPPGAEERPTLQEDLRDVQEVVADLIRADNRGDLEAAVAVYAPDGVLIPPGGEEIVGADDIRAHYAATLEKYEMRLDARPRETVVTGDWAFSRGITVGMLSPAGNGDSVRVRDHYLMLLRRGEGGGWKVARLIWNEAPPETTDG